MLLCLWGSSLSIAFIHHVLSKGTGVHLTDRLQAEHQRVYDAWFDNLNQGTGDDLLTGEQVREMFLHSQVSNDILLKVWSLSDRHKRRVLDRQDFYVRAFLLHSCLAFS